MRLLIVEDDDAFLSFLTTELEPRSRTAGFSDTSSVTPLQWGAISSGFRCSVCILTVSPSPASSEQHSPSGFTLPTEPTIRSMLH
jgi:hypothetical protein